MQPPSRQTDPAAAGPGDPPGPEPVPSPVAPTERRRGWLARMFRSHVRPVFSRRLSRLAAAVVPSIYLGYMRLVRATSRVDAHNFQDLHGIIERHNGAVGLLWHEEVMTVAYGYYYLGFRPHTLASVGDSGELIARCSTAAASSSSAADRPAAAPAAARGRCRR